MIDWLECVPTLFQRLWSYDCMALQKFLSHDTMQCMQSALMFYQFCLSLACLSVVNFIYLIWTTVVNLLKYMWTRYGMRPCSEQNASLATPWMSFSRLRSSAGHQCYFSYGFSVSVIVVIYQLQFQLQLYNFFLFFSFSYSCDFSVTVTVIVFQFLFQLVILHKICLSAWK